MGSCTYLPGLLINDPKFKCVVDVMLIIGHDHLGGLEKAGSKPGQRCCGSGAQAMRGEHNCWGETPTHTVEGRGNNMRWSGRTSKGLTLPPPGPPQQHNPSASIPLLHSRHVSHAYTPEWPSRTRAADLGKQSSHTPGVSHLPLVPRPPLPSSVHAVLGSCCFCPDCNPHVHKSPLH